MPADLAFLAAAMVLPGIAAGHAAYQKGARRRSAVQTIRVNDDTIDTPRLLAVSGSSARTPLDRDDVISLRSDRVHEGDLLVTGNDHFRQPLKVTGDLEIVGRAVFDAPVVVNGHVSVDGEAVFGAGLLTKCVLHVAGHARFGTDGSGSWCVARDIVGTQVRASGARDEYDPDAVTA